MSELHLDCLLLHPTVELNWRAIIQACRLMIEG
jgi:hypothetical protein